MHSTAAPPLLLLLLLAFYSAPLLNAKAAAAAAAAGKNTFTPKAYVIRYWQKQVSNNLPKPSFLLGKASPLTAADYATFSKLAVQDSLSTHLPDFCSKANLFCFPDVNFAKNLNNDGTNHGGGADGVVINGRNKNYGGYNKRYGTNHGGGADGFVINGRNKYYGGHNTHYGTNHGGGADGVVINSKNKYYGGRNTHYGTNHGDVEPGNFFREEMLKSGTIMPMPDIHDKMPERSFLPRVIVSKLPFSTSKLVEMKKLFHATDDSSLVKMMTNSLSECERAPSPGEVKRCVASIEDMVDFATTVLGRNVVARSTYNIQGSKGNIMIGKVKGINGGRVTISVSCHPSFYPYMIYYCHSVPKVRVYEADILDPTSKATINHGVAICHMDTSSWSPGHEAFITLGSKPGKIEVCHWIYENDVNWTIAD